MLSPALDILAIAAHRDDVEQTCGGTLLKMAQRGHRTGILDLTQGEMGTRGTVQDRAREAEEAAKILCVSWRQALDIPDEAPRDVYGYDLLLLRPDMHVVWRGNDAPPEPEKLAALATGHGNQ